MVNLPKLSVIIFIIQMIVASEELVRNQVSKQALNSVYLVFFFYNLLVNYMIKR